MQFAALKVFCDVARFRSFSQAAQANDITQSAASQIVSQLERRLEIQLMDRSTRPLQLTSLGQTYYEGCKTLIEQYDELEASIRNAQEELAGTVQVAAIYSVGLGDMGQYVQRFTHDQPSAQVHVEYLHPDRVYEKVLDGTADLGLVSFPKTNSKLTTLPWRAEAMVLACSPKNPLAHNLAIRTSQLAGQKYVHFDKNLDIRKHVDRFLREQEAPIEVVLEFDNIENIKQAVGIGAGVALLPEPTLRREVKARTLVALPLVDGSLTRPLGIIHRRRHKLSATARKFLALLREGHTALPGQASDEGAFAAGTVFNHESSRGRNGAARTTKNKSHV